MAAPVINPISSATVPAGKTLIVPLRGFDADGDPLSYSVSAGGDAVTATLHTGNPYLKLSVAGYGVMTFQLFQDLAPNTVKRIGDLVKSGFYDGLTFHRVIPSFVIQGGDPNGDGSGGPGFSFDDEFNADAVFSGDGQLAMANSGKDTNGSQFFITIGPQRFLDFNHTIFGQLVRGFDVLSAIKSAPRGANDKPTTPIVITSATIVPDTSDAVLTLKAVGSGSSTITVTADDGTGNAVSQVFDATVAADTVNDPPILGPVVVPSGTANSPISLDLSSFDLEGDPVSYAAAVDSTGNATVTVVGNVVTFTPKANFVGTVRAAVGVKQQGATTRGSTSSPFDTQQVILNFRQVLSAQGVAVTATEGTALIDVPVATFTAAALGTAAQYTATIDWGDGVSTLGTVQAQAGGGYRVVGSHTYASFGSRPITVSIHDGVNSVDASTSTTAVVADAPLSAALNGMIVAPPARSVSGVVGVVVDGNPMSVASDLTVTISWGDGSTSLGGLQSSGAQQYLVRGSHIYAATGAYPLKITVSGVGPGATTATAGGTITITNLTPAIAPIGDQTVTEGIPFSYRVEATTLADTSDPYASQTLQFALAPGAPDGMTIDPTTGRLSWLPTSGGPPVTVTVVVTDTTAPPVSATRTIRFVRTNIAPRIVLPAGQTIPQGGSLRTLGSFADPGQESFDGDVDYGDGSPLQPLILNPDRTFVLDHAFAAAGSYTIRVRVRDGSDEAQATLPVNVTPPPPTTVAALQLATDKKGNITAVKLVFAGALDPGTASNTTSYRLISAPGRDKKYGTKDDVVIRFRAANYADGSVTLTPAGKPVKNGVYQFRAVGLRDRFGRSIDGDADGALGGDFVATIRKGTVRAASVVRTTRFRPGR